MMTESDTLSNSDTLSESDTLYNIVRNSNNSVLVPPSKDKYLLCCCISEKWWFDHTSIPVINEYDKNDHNCCICLDCCTWCLEFRVKKKSICSKNINCYLCCCVIYFI
jgi:hypothetical protein